MSLLQEGAETDKKPENREKKDEKKIVVRFLPNTSIPCSNLKGCSKRENEAKNVSLPFFDLCNKLH